MIAKRIFDLVASSIGLVLLLPLFLVIGVLIKLDSRGPVFYRQERMGRGGRTFRIHKFRSMRNDHTGLQITTTGDSRIDELPQLLDVLRGDMSLVGPRPEVPRYMRLYPEADQAKILSVRPGMTDWTSIRFRNESELLEGAPDPEVAYVERVMPLKAKMYRDYVDHRSFQGDLAILVATFLAIVSRK
jgi:lipopolysaccharide/colanic/teichoic acid biosynthesis glycosyltransferase